MATARTPFALIETPRQIDNSLEGLTSIRRMPMPSTFCLQIQSKHGDVELADKCNASAIFTGMGGDELFFQGGPIPSAVDFAFLHGVNRKLWPVVLSDSAQTNHSVWEILRAAFRYGLLRRRWNFRDFYCRHARPLVANRIHELATRDGELLHPLMKEAGEVPPGKLIQVYLTFLQATRAHNPCMPDSAAVSIAPLVSQPLIELSLRIPLYVLRSGGRDRAVARDAFKNDLPRQIFARRAKGGVNDHLKSIIATNLQFIRRFLLDGTLAQQGYLNVAALQAVLSGEPSRIESQAIHLFKVLDVEAWMRSWMDRAAAKQAA